jgi:hypothetical protein
MVEIPHDIPGSDFMDLVVAYSVPIDHITADYYPDKPIEWISEDELMEGLRYLVTGVAA